MGTRNAKTKSKSTTAKRRGERKFVGCFFNTLDVERANSARAAVKAFRTVCETDNEDAVGDLIVNLLHLARQDQGAKFHAEKYVSRLLETFEEEEEEARSGHYY